MVFGPTVFTTSKQTSTKLLFISVKIFPLAVSLHIMKTKQTKKLFLK